MVLHLKKLNPFYLKMHCAKFNWNWSSETLWRKFLFRRSIFAISLLSPLGKGRGPSFEQTRVLITQRRIVPSSGEEDFSNLLMYFRYFVIISPWNRFGPSFEETWVPFTQGYFVPSLVKIGPVVLEKKIFKIC